MFAQYFGQFLLNNGLISTSGLDRAMSAQKETRVKLGVLAINRGFMTPAQVETVHQAQTRMDKRFGEIAVELGFISEASIDELLSAQQHAHLALGQSLIDQGSLTYEQFGEALELYKKNYSLSDETFDSILSGSIETLLETVLAKEGVLAGDPVLLDYVSLFAKNLIRFIDDDIRLELVPSGASVSYDWVAQQPLLNSDRCLSRITAIGGSEQSFLAIASLYAEETVDEPGEMMDAAIGEFLNVHNGIFLVNLSNQGKELELDPQSVVAGTEFVPTSTVAVTARVSSSRFQLDLILTGLSDLT